MLAIELGLPRPIPDLCLHRARTHNAALITTCASHHSTSQLTVPLAQTRVSQETTQTPWAGCAHPVPHASSSWARARPRAAPMGPAWMGNAQRCPLAPELRRGGRRVARAAGSGRRGTWYAVQTVDGPLGSSDVAELKGSEEGQEREGSRSVGGLGPSPLATPSSE